MSTIPTILIIDDDPDICENLQMVLEDHGYNVSTAANGNLGLQVAERYQPQLVILDMMMPGMSGFLVLEQLKMMFAGKLPVIMFTANESPEQRRYAEFLGVNAFVNKPIGISELMQHIQSFIPAPSGLKTYAIPPIKNSTF